MRRTLLFLTLIFVTLAATACGSTEPAEPADTAGPAFVPLALTDDTNALEETLTIMALSFRHPTHYAVLFHTNTAAQLQAHGDVNLVVSAGFEAATDPTTMADMMEVVTATVEEHEVLEQGDLLIHGVAWDHMTIRYTFDAHDLFHTILLTTADGVVYAFTFAAPFDQMEALRADRSAMVSSLAIGELDAGAGDVSISDLLSQFSDRFIMARTGDAVPEGFSEAFDAYDFFGERFPFFVFEGATYFLFETESPLVGSDEAHTNLAVLREDLLFGEVSTDFSRARPDVEIEIPSAAVLARTQAAVGLFSDLLSDFNEVPVSADAFNTAERMEGPFAMFEPSHYAVRSDGFSQVMWKITGETVSLDFTALVLIYEGDTLIGAMLVPGNM
ncbi:MAG: hypothetical protein FWD84_07170 [Oscillospiraceae bacterium]|nr:hypothetical protein [Oscillospiraceae bacterium]